MPPLTLSHTLTYVPKPQMFHVPTCFTFNWHALVMMLTPLQLLSVITIPQMVEDAWCWREECKNSLVNKTQPM